MPYLPSLAPPPSVTLLGLASLIIFGIGWIISVKAKHKRAYAVGRTLAKWGLIGFLFSTVLYVFSAGPTIITIYVPALFNSPVAAAVAALVGMGLFFLRKKFLGLYGGLEIVGSLATLAVCGFTSYGSASQRGIALLGAVYFLVRGLDNAEKGDLAGGFKRAISFIGVAQAATLAVAIGVVATTATLPSRDDDIKPPYLGGRDGSRLPVSAMKCGGLFIVCDEAAWREHDRLARATPAERAQEEAEAGRRFNEHFPRRREQTATATPAKP